MKVEPKLRMPLLAAGCLLAGALLLVGGYRWGYARGRSGADTAATSRYGSGSFPGGSGYGDGSGGQFPGGYDRRRGTQASPSPTADANGAE